MNALKSARLREKKARDAEIRKTVVREYNKLREQNLTEQVESSKYNAMLHVLHLFCVLNDEFGFGKKRLQRLLDAFAAQDAQFKADLEDGVAWTKIFAKLDRIGLKFELDRAYAERVMQRKYERNVRRYEESK